LKVGSEKLKARGSDQLKVESEKLKARGSDQLKVESEKKLSTFHFPLLTGFPYA
jgi:hypothetical protein